MKQFEDTIKTIVYTSHGLRGRLLPISSPIKLPKYHYKEDWITRFFGVYFDDLPLITKEELKRLK